MWILERNDHTQELKMSIDPIYVRKLRTLMPRPFTCSSSSSNGTAPCCANIPTWNQHYPSGVMSSDYGGKREITRVPIVSSRWKPTGEQVQALEEMYRRGTKTPSAEQIQQIAAKLRRFGKIEGKNVFYWFQNHKARERQKKRRQLELLAVNKPRDVQTPERTQSGVSRRYLETEHPKKWTTPSNCSTHSEHGAVVEQCKQDGWTQLDLSFCMPPNNSIHKATATGQENEKPFFALALTKSDGLTSVQSHEIKQNQTLQLFPERSNDFSGTEEENHAVVNLQIGSKSVFEFLPTKH